MAATVFIVYLSKYWSFIAKNIFAGCTLNGKIVCQGAVVRVREMSIQNAFYGFLKKDLSQLQFRFEVKNLSSKIKF